LKKDAPSEVGTPGYSPSLWKEIKHKNSDAEKNRVYDSAPAVIKAPKSWLI